MWGLWWRLCETISRSKSRQSKQGDPSKANEADIVVIIKAMCVMMEWLRKYKDDTINELKSEIVKLNMKVKILEEKPQIEDEIATEEKMALL